ncbi:unnamed protein product, partial [Polarella glacialis]
LLALHFAGRGVRPQGVRALGKVPMLPISPPRSPLWHRNVSRNSTASYDRASSLGSAETSEHSLEQGLVLQTKSNDETRRRLNSMVSAGFIKSTSAGNLGSDGDGKLEIARRTVASGLQHNAADITFGLVICLDVIFNIVDIDSRAGGGTTPLWAEIGSVTCLAGYTLEFLLKFFVSGRKLFKDVWSVADLCIICSGIFEVILTACGIPAGSVTLLRLLRLLRIIRLMKLCRQFRWLSELRKLMMMMASCLRTLFWSFLFCFI